MNRNESGVQTVRKVVWSPAAHRRYHHAKPRTGGRSRASPAGCPVPWAGLVVHVWKVIPVAP